MTTSAHEHTDGIRENLDTPPPVYYKILLGGLIIWAALFSGYYLLSGWSSSGEFQEKMTSHQQNLAKSAAATR